MNPPIARWHIHYGTAPIEHAVDVCPGCDLEHSECSSPACGEEHILAFTASELREHQGRIIRAAVYSAIPKDQRAAIADEWIDSIIERVDETP